MSSVRDTSLKTYDEIKEEGLYDTDMEMVYDAVKNFPLLTGREYASIVLKYEDMNKVRPRITDLKNAGIIIEVGKRKCSRGGRLSYVWATREGAEKMALRKAGFKEEVINLFTCEQEGLMCYQDFRHGKRRSYAYSKTGKSYNCNTFDKYNVFKEELARLLNSKNE